MTQDLTRLQRLRASAPHDPVAVVTVRMVGIAWLPARGSRPTDLVDQTGTVPEVLELGAGVWPFTLTDPAQDRSQAVSIKDRKCSDAGYAPRHAHSSRQLQATARDLRGSTVLTGDKEQCQND